MIIIIIAAQLALALAVIISSVQQENRHYFGILLARGFGKSGVFKFLFSQIFIIYFLGLLFGIIAGIIGGNVIMYLLNSIVFRQLGFLPVVMNPFDLIQIIGIIIGVSLVIFLISYLFEMRKSIDEYLRNF
jgi:hypothetical protein